MDTLKQAVENVKARALASNEAARQAVEHAYIDGLISHVQFERTVATLQRSAELLREMGR